MGLPVAALGRTGMEITRVGIGCWAIGGGGWAYGWGAQDDDSSVATIQHAVELGVNWIDTAAEYGLGHAESVVGRALRALPAGERPYVFTKCGLAWDPSDRRAPSRAVASAASLRRECDDSLRRLGVEQIDLYQLHWPPEDGTPVDEYWGTLLSLRSSGKVRAIGLSNFDVAGLSVASSLGRVDTLQPPLSLIDRRAASSVIPWCLAEDVGVIVYSPMQSGLLTGAFSASRVASLPDDDWRRSSPDFTERLPANLALSSALEPVASRHGVSRSAVAVAWTLSVPGVTGAIVGARRPSQVDDWIAAGSLSLTPEDLAEIAAAVRSSGAGEGPV
jgi:aryl-alcohol dehydrogenase-like predicted oxidoreductase